MKPKSVLTALALALLLVVALDASAFAASGKSLLLGRLSKAKQVTTLSRVTPGPALGLRTTNSVTAPMTVNGRGRVNNLNADLLDGLDAAALQTRAHVSTYGIPTARNNVLLPVLLPAGHYVVSYSAYLLGTTGKDAGCYLRRTGAGLATAFVAESRLTSATQPAGLTGTGFVTVPSGAALALICTSTNGTFTTTAAQPIQVVATSVVQVVTAAPVTARLSAPTR